MVLNRSREKVAMMICVRDEARFLGANLLYHHAIGVQRAYVYLDRCTDGSERIAASFPWAKIVRISPDDAARFPYVQDLQRMCMNRALKDARDEGFDWLLYLDADEFAVEDPSHDGQRSHSQFSIVQLVEKAKPDTEVIRLTPRELLPMDMSPARPFWAQHYFLQSPRFSRDILDPIEDVVKQHYGYLGHKEGKSIVRTSADVQAFTPHTWTRNQGIAYPHLPGQCDLRTENLGSHLHYLFTDWRQWLDKHRKFSHEPAKWRIGGNVLFPKQCWKEASRQFTEEEAREYFARWVAASPSLIQELMVSGKVGHDRVVEQVLQKSGAIVGDELQLVHQPQLDLIEDWKLPNSFWWEDSDAVSCLSDGSVSYRIANLPIDRITGLRGPFYDGRQRFRRIGGAAEISLDLAPDDYAVTLSLPEWNAGSISIHFDGRIIHQRVRRDRQQRLTVKLSKHDFATRNEHRLQIELHPTAWQRLRGKRVSIGISEISFDPIRSLGQVNQKRSAA